ncbi:MAG TPA: bifunctional diaminohydroxyphosphoribosylaminopyrimidine deaminase/5-amino-6-(5-phosphoribosylamino)uracil reductase RibD, partial [Stellaceae bacterium]|nr:bifunctional diaminohydroxyphosphoribosylaminopyrimidine deaminase/5-amino-6-(5-phosphoribosylamino)uracil reductase RibD [Stellaceae bacterium]
RVVLPVEDPDPRVSGRGIARLREAGVEVETGLLADEARALNEGFFRRINDGRPLVTLKLASTLDGRIATSEGESRWITGALARERAHLLRARFDAVMAGSNTVLADDPELTCRLPGLADRSPVRIVVDGRLRVPLTAALVATARTTPTWFVTLKGDAPERHRAFRDCGVELLEVAAAGETVDLAAAFQELGRRGLTRVLVEGGATLAAALLRAGLVDHVAWFRAPRLIGGDGVPAIEAFGIDKLESTPSFERVALEALGEDVLETFRRL